MTTVVILVLVGSATHATWNLLVSRTDGADARLFVWAYSTFSLVVLAPASTIAVLIGADMSWRLVWASLASGVFHTAYALALQAAYARSDVNVAYPVARGLGPVLVALVAVVALGETLGWASWLGIALITAGVAMVSTGSSSDAAGRARRAFAGGCSSPAPSRSTPCGTLVPSPTCGSIRCSTTPARDCGCSSC